MNGLQEKVQQFVKFSGIKIPQRKPQELQTHSFDLDLPKVLSSPEAETNTPTAFGKFQPATKHPWKNGKYTLPATLALGFVGMGGVVLATHLKLGGFHFSTGSARTDEKLETVDHPTGKYATSAIAGGDWEGFGQTPSPLPSPTPKVKPIQGKSIAKGQVAPKNTVSASTLPRSDIPTTRPYVAPRYPVIRQAPTDYDSNSRPIRAYHSTPVASRSVTTSPQQQRSPEQRRADAIAATTFNGGSSSASSPSSNGSAQMVAAISQSGEQTGSQEASQGTPQGQQAKGEYLAAENAVLDGTPQQLINRAKKAEGVLLQGLAFTPGDLKYLEDQEVTAEISNPLDSGLPVGTQIICAVKFPNGGGAQAKNAVVRLVPTAIVMNGNEYEVPAGSAILTAKHGKPFIAKRGGSEFLRFLGSATKTVLSAGAGTLSSLVGGGSNILSSLVGLGSGRAVGTQNQATEVLILKDNLPVQLSIVRPFSIPLASTENFQPVAQRQEPMDVVQESSNTEPMRFSQDPSDAQLMAIVNNSQEEANAQ
ncbi:MAG: hypothetical protein HC852_07160 [Acaryochloridaceae cyanobacterium RU_4_10]|nr:hypothetical protein [Acaryochloridaceae cyanobacterium RU_4_10]